MLDTACRPVPNTGTNLACRRSGAYDTKGYRLRGYQYADDDGRWWFSTIVPAAYAGRTRHYHVKVKAPVAHTYDSCTSGRAPEQPR